MAKKKKVAGAGAALKPEPKKKEDPEVIFESWFKTACTDEQKTTISDVEEHLKEIQDHRKDSRRELQPLRVGMELQKVRFAITGESGAASPQKETGRIWGAYRDSHLKKAGYSKSSCDTYVGMIAAARTILPDDSLINALLDYINDKTGMVMLVGGKVDKPFGKYTMYLQSKDVQMHVRDGKVNLDDLSVDDLVANVFLPENAETPDTLSNMTLAVNGVVKRIFNEVKEEVKVGKEPFDLSKVVENARDYVRHVVECLLLVCKCEDMTTFEAKDEEIIEQDSLRTLEAVVKEVNEQKKASAAKATKPKKVKKVAHVKHEPEKVTQVRIGKYIISRNPSPPPLHVKDPWQIFAKGGDTPIAWATDSLQAERIIAQLEAKDNAVQANEQSKDAHSDRPSSPAAQQNEETRKQRERQGGKHYDAG